MPLVILEKRSIIIVVEKATALLQIYTGKLRRRRAHEEAEPRTPHKKYGASLANTADYGHGRPQTGSVGIDVTSS